MKLEWSEEALGDLNRFALFLRTEHPYLAARVASEIKSRASLLELQPNLGRPLSSRTEYRQLVLRVLNAAYVFQYRYDGERLVMLRVLHPRESR
jgi:plasmid stabilization system protein ParE